MGIEIGQGSLKYAMELGFGSVFVEIVTLTDQSAKVDAFFE
jgi:hypothetical protein